MLGKFHFTRLKLEHVQDQSRAITTRERQETDDTKCFPPQFDEPLPIIDDQESQLEEVLAELP